MIRPETNEIYEIELCSGERLRWQYLGSDSFTGIWWRNLETGREFNEANLMYSWSIVSKLDDLSAINIKE